MPSPFGRAEWREIYSRLPSGTYERVLEIKYPNTDWMEVEREIVTIPPVSIVKDQDA